MIAVNPKMLAAGAAMMASGFVFVWALDASLPTGDSGMTGEEIAELEAAQRQNGEMRLLASILIGVGFLFVLISFGTARRRGGAKKVTEKKPAQ